MLGRRHFLLLRESAGINFDITKQGWPHLFEQG
jgi:hypothetical protein